MVCNSQATGSEALFWLLRAPDTHIVHRHIYRQSTKHTKFFKKSKTIEIFCFTRHLKKGPCVFSFFLVCHIASGVSLNNFVILFLSKRDFERS